MSTCSRSSDMLRPRARGSISQEKRTPAPQHMSCWTHWCTIVGSLSSFQSLLLLFVRLAQFFAQASSLYFFLSALNVFAPAALELASSTHIQLRENRKLTEKTGHHRFGAPAIGPKPCRWSVCVWTGSALPRILLTPSQMTLCAKEIGWLSWG